MKARSTAGLRVVATLGLAMAVAACGGIGPDTLGGPTEATGTGGGDVRAQESLALVGAWKGVSLTPAGEAATVFHEPERFTAEFRADGTLALGADCNRCAAGYSAGPGSLSVTPMACTRAYCASAPLDTQFAALVSAATSWAVVGDSLELTSTAGAIRLRR
jgi:heat shock protein HslJ